MIVVLPHLVQKPYCHIFHCDGCANVESSVGFFNVDCVAQDSFLGVVSSDVMDEVEEA